MKHVIDGVCRAFSVLVPLQDGHCSVQLDCQRQVECRRGNSRFSKSQVYTVPLEHISSPPFCLSWFKKRRCRGPWVKLHSLLLSAYQHLQPSSSPSFAPSQSAVALPLTFSCFLSLPFSLIYRLGKLGHTGWLWGCVQLWQHCKWLLIIPITEPIAEQCKGVGRKESPPQRLQWSRIGWVSNTAVEYKCGVRWRGELQTSRLCRSKTHEPY